MDADLINDKIYAGRGKAALRLGLDYQIYRPNSADSPTSNLITTLKAAFNAGDNTYRQPNEYGDPIWHADLDGRFSRVGDYLVRVNDNQTYYIAGQQPLLPIIAIDCNRSIKITRKTPETSVGAIGYGGLTPATETTVLGSTTAWPCSILLGGRRQATGANLPADVGQAGYKILLPPSVPVMLMYGDIGIDDLGRRYEFEGAELTDLGYRIIANELHT